MPVVDPWHWLEPGGTLPPDLLRQRPELMRVAEAIAAGWDLPKGMERPTLLLCTRRSQRKPCRGQLRVCLFPDDRLVVDCPLCGAEEMRIQNWHLTPWAGPRPQPTPSKVALTPPAVDFEELLTAVSEDSDEWQAYLDIETGRIIRLPIECFRQLEGEPPTLFADLELVRASAEEAARIYHDESGRYAAIEPMVARQSFALMESFVAGLRSSPIRRHLSRALEGKKPFLEFPVVLRSNRSIESRWFAYERAAHRDYALRWLEDVYAEYSMSHPARPVRYARTRAQPAGDRRPSRAPPPD